MSVGELASSRIGESVSCRETPTLQFPNSPIWMGHGACSRTVDANEHIYREDEVKLSSAIMTGALACALGLVAPQVSHAQGATPSSGAGQSQVGNGNGVPSSPGTQGTTDRSGQT